MKYWVYINDQVLEDSYEIEALPSIDGFTQETLILPESTEDGSEPQWLPAHNYLDFPQEVTSLEETPDGEEPKTEILDHVEQEDYEVASAQNTQFPAAQTANPEPGAQAEDLEEKLEKTLFKKIDDLTNEIRSLKMQINTLSEEISHAKAVVPAVAPSSAEEQEDSKDEPKTQTLSESEPKTETQHPSEEAQEQKEETKTSSSTAVVAAVAGVAAAAGVAAVLSSGSDKSEEIEEVNEEPSEGKTPVHTDNFLEKAVEDTISGSKKQEEPQQPKEETMRDLTGRNQVVEASSSEAEEVFTEKEAPEAENFEEAFDQQSPEKIEEIEKEVQEQLAKKAEEEANENIEPLPLPTTEESIATAPLQSIEDTPSEDEGKTPENPEEMPLMEETSEPAIKPEIAEEPAQEELSELEEVSLEETPAQDAPAAEQELPVEEASVEETPAEAAPVAEESEVEELPAEEPIAQEIPVAEEAPVEEPAPQAESQIESLPASEPVQEAAAEETPEVKPASAYQMEGLPGSEPAQEEPAQEAPAEEAQSEEFSAQQPQIEGLPEAEPAVEESAPQGEAWPEAEQPSQDAQEAAPENEVLSQLEETPLPEKPVSQIEQSSQNGEGISLAASETSDSSEDLKAENADEVDPQANMISELDKAAEGANLYDIVGDTSGSEQNIETLEELTSRAPALKEEELASSQNLEDKFLKTFTTSIEEVFLDQPTSIISDYVPPAMAEAPAAKPSLDPNIAAQQAAQRGASQAQAQAAQLTPINMVNLKSGSSTPVQQTPAQVAPMQAMGSEPMQEPQAPAPQVQGLPEGFEPVAQPAQQNINPNDPLSGPATMTATNPASYDNDTQQVRRIKPAAIKTVPMLSADGTDINNMGYDVSAENIDEAVVAEGPSQSLKFVKMFSVIFVLLFVLLLFIALLASMGIVSAKMSPVHAVVSKITGKKLSAPPSEVQKVDEAYQAKEEAAAATAAQQIFDKTAASDRIIEIVKSYQLGGPGDTLESRINYMHENVKDQLTWEAKESVDPRYYSIAVRLPANAEGYALTYRFNYNTETEEVVPTTSEANNVLNPSGNLTMAQQRAGARSLPVTAPN